MHVSILVCYTSGDLVELASIDACLTRRTWNSRVSYDVILTPHESTHVPRVAAHLRVRHLCRHNVQSALVSTRNEDADVAVLQHPQMSKIWRRWYE